MKAAELVWSRPTAIRGVTGQLPELVVHGYLAGGQDTLSFADFRTGPIPAGGGAEYLPACGLSAMKATWLETCEGHPKHALFGCMAGDPDGLCLTQFLPSPKFVRLLHATIAMLCPIDAEMQRLAAESQGNTNCYLFDARTPDPGGGVPLEDILGCFKVADGAVIPGSYSGNEGSHRLLTEHGMFQVDGHYQRGLCVWFEQNVIPEGYFDPTPPYATW